jgi:hypothetical protein
VTDRAADRVAQLVYIDTGPLPDGVAQVEFIPFTERECNAASVAYQVTGRLPPPPWADLAAGVPDVDDSIVALLRARSVDQPWATATAPVRLSGAWEKLPRLGVLSSFTISQVQTMATAMPLCRHMTGDAWRFEELPTWHWPMLSRPAELAAILHRALLTA